MFVALLRYVSLFFSLVSLPCVAFTHPMPFGYPLKLSACYDEIYDEISCFFSSAMFHFQR